MPLHLLLRTQLKLLFQNRAAVLILMALPLVLTWLFTQINTSSSKRTLYVSDSDQSSYSAQMLELLQQQNVAVIKTSMVSIDHLLDTQKIDTALEIQKGFAQNLMNSGTPALSLVKLYDSADSAFASQNVTDCYRTLVQTVQGSEQAAKTLLPTRTDAQASMAAQIQTSVMQSKKSNLSVQAISITGSNQNGQIDNTSRSLLGMIVLFLWVAIVQGCRTIVEEKENGTTRRMISTPAQYGKVLLAKFLALYIYGAAHIAVILIAGRFLFHLQAFSHLPQILLILCAYLFAALGITLLFTLRARTQQMFSSIGLPVVILAGMLGGTFFPMDVAPQLLRVLSRFTPQGWVMPALTGLYAGNSAALLGTSCVLLTAVGAAATVIFFGLQRRHLNAAACS